MPIGLLGARWRGSAFENLANGDGPPLGRELEMANLLRFIRDNDIANVVWLTADVHYTAAHYYDPNQARFQEFAPFWEFVSGPLNAGTFGPGELDDTFGPQLVFAKAPPAGQVNLPPSAGLQFFGQVDIDEAEVMTVTLKDLDGAALFVQDARAVAHGRRNALTRVAARLALNPPRCRPPPGPGPPAAGRPARGPA